MYVLICEDCRKDLKLIHERLQKTELPPDTEYRLFTDGETLLKSIETGKKPDMVFLDVDMPNLSGIEVGNRIYEKNKLTKIIFITNYPQFAIDAFDCNAFYYLLKTDSDEKVCAVVRRAIEAYRISHAEFITKDLNGILKIPVSDIYYIESGKRRLIVHTKTETIEVLDTLKEALKQLSVHGFFLSHKSVMVNLGEIMRFRRDSIVLKNGEEVVFSIRKKSAVMRAFSEYLERTV